MSSYLSSKQGLSIQLRHLAPLATKRSYDIHVPKKKRNVEERGWGVYSLSGTTVVVTEQIDQLLKKKMMLECKGRRLLTFSPLFSYQVMERKKRGRQELALSGKPGL